MVNFKIDRFKYTWRANWVTGTEYNRDDIVYYNGTTYVCIRQHTASSLLEQDQIFVPAVIGSDGSNPVQTFNVISVPNPEGSGAIYQINGVNRPVLTLIRGGVYTFVQSDPSNVTHQIAFKDGAGNPYTFGVNTTGPVGQTGAKTVLTVFGNAPDDLRYYCVTHGNGMGNTITVTGAESQDVKPAWTAMIESNTFVGEWTGTNQYYKGNIVSYGGNLYLCTATHLSTITLEGNLSDWTIYLDSVKFRNEWQPVTEYRVGDVVRYNGIVYECIETHNSNNENSGLEIDQEKWQTYYEGISYQGTYASSITYLKNDLVEYQGSLIKCLVSHISNLQIDSTKWELQFPGFQYNNDWQLSQYYGIGSVVRHGGDVYYSVTNNINKIPTRSIYDIQLSEDGSTLDINWIKLSNGIRLLGNFDKDFSYKSGDIVRFGGNLYSCQIDSDISNDESTLSYLDESNWKLLNVGSNWRFFWQTETVYNINDVVLFLGTAYKCKVYHEPNLTNFPNSTNGSLFWEVLIQGNQTVGINEPGDLLTYGTIIDQINFGNEEFDESLLIKGPTRVKLIEANTLASIVESNLVKYVPWGANERVVYVAPTGADTTDTSYNGFSPLFPWKTVKFASEQVNDNFQGTTTIRVETGVYEEILPIIVPKNTAIQGSELRSTTIKPNKPSITVIENQYIIAVLERLKTILPLIIVGQSFEKTPGNSESFNISLVASEDNIPLITSLIDNIISYINFYLNSTGTSPQLFGTNEQSTTNQAVDIINVNQKFLEQESVAFLKNAFPEYTFNENELINTISEFINAWKYDITISGNYKSILAARYYRNTVLGSAGEDMFYLRDTTGLRDMTITGLTGILNPPGVFELFRLPTGGAFCSLDPGWGPNDEAVWIVNRSPYIQGVTTIGDNCIGQKIDGSLHAGGNKSMVSNDFTQVISDGIGAWILNNGRAELVSVFTYYCNVGYLTTGGGVIRATNGNCSYGNFGAIANGIDATEQAKTAVVNNRSQQATVSSILSDGATEGIQIFEWANAGQFYTEATATIIGAGSGAQTKFEDFRDDAIFEARLLDTSSTVVENIGGGGYTIAQNNVQDHQTPGGDAVSITIASNDSNQEADYIGMRIIIINGAGAGQYGYITGYNTVTKVITVSRESDNQPGWDHVVPGTPAVVPLNNTATYRIEPRVTFEDPGFDATNITIPASSNWSRIVYGETTEQYANISSSAGTGDTIDIEPASARFNVVKTGRTYTVSLENGGAGYTIGDEIILLGTSLGGITPENDVIITVVQTTDDSTNAVTEFTFQGTGISGRYVMTTRGGEASSYSRTGIDWDNTTLPSSGDWDCLAAGLNRFVAIRSNSNQAAYSLDGVTWSAATMPATRNWRSVIFGNGQFLAIASDQNSAALSVDGITWTTTSMPVFGDSTNNEWVDVTYGKNLFVAVANSGNISAYSSDGISWQGTIMDVIADSTQKDWVSVAYGNNRFVAISSQGDIAYSFDGIEWRSAATMPSQDGSTAHNWKRIRYAQGVFFAVGDTGSRNVSGDVTTGPTTFAATSHDGIVWAARELASSLAWEDIAFGNPYVQQEDSTVGKNSPRWIAVAANIDTVNLIRTGARALGRVKVSTGIINELSIWDPGSGYRSANPAVTIVSPTRTADAVIECRLADGVLANPSWINRGFGFRTLTTTVTVSGNGFADVIPDSTSVVINELQRLPGPGFQILFTGNSRIYTIVTVTELANNNAGETFSARLRIDPALRARDKLEHGTAANLRERISQCRITGHDFLDVGTGNFAQTNYPELYITGEFTPRPENEVVEQNGGRVFYTSTDQLGNFRAGELFAVEQATGIVTISADFFDLRGLTELALGGIRVGGSGVVIREFSTDPLFIADSNNIVPTQRAIAAFLNNRLTVGGSEISVPSFISGQVVVGPDQIGSSSGAPIIFSRMAIFDGSDGVAGNIAGSIMAQTMFYRSFIDKIL